MLDILQKLLGPGQAHAAASTLAQPPKPPSMMDAWKGAIRNIESVGSGDYRALGPVTKSGDRAYGAYQVMGNNVGPWTEKWYGKRLTPQEFLLNDEAQERVFEGEFGSYVEKHGNPQDAASKWFTGKPLAEGKNRRDINNFSGAQYVNKFNNYLNSGGTVSRKGEKTGGESMDPQNIMQTVLTRLMNEPATAPPPRSEEDMKRDRIRRALAEAGAAMVSTPGDFGTGIAAGVTAGARGYHDAVAADNQDAMDRQDQGLSDNRRRMMDIFQIAGSLDDVQRRRRDEDFEAEKRERQIEQDKAEQDRLLKRDQRQQQKDKREARTKYEQLVSDKEKNLNLSDEFLSDEERMRRIQELEDYKKRLAPSYGIDLGGAAPKTSRPTPGALQPGRRAVDSNGTVHVLQEDGTWVPE